MILACIESGTQAQTNTLSLYIFTHQHLELAISSTTRQVKLALLLRTSSTQSMAIGVNDRVSRAEDLFTQSQTLFA